MAVRIRNDSWKNDHDLEDILRKYVRKGLQPEEILDFVSRDLSQYAWSLRTLDSSVKLCSPVCSLAFYA